jgi:uncharacterized protein YijF (DUF1287 family)
MEYSLKDILFRTYEDRQQIEIEEEVETDSKKIFRGLTVLKFWKYKRTRTNKIK